MHVRRWQSRLAPLAEALPSKPPPKDLWAKIEARTVNAQAPAIAPQTVTSAKPQKTSRWREWFSFGNVGLLATGAAMAFAVFTIVPIIQKMNAPQVAQLPTMGGLPQSYVAVMSGADEKAAFLVSSPRHSNELAIKVLAQTGATDAQQLRLWALPKDGAPQSLGILPASGKGAITMPDTAEKTLGQIPFLGVTIEPKGTQVAALPEKFAFRGPCVKLW
jgi:anti-sigma-K factor RskA